MPRLIDVDKLGELKFYLGNWTPTEWQKGWNDALDTIMDEVPTVDIDAITESHEKIGYDKGFRDGYAQATVDAGEVVRCKDCKFYWKNSRNADGVVCLATPKDEAYCSEGERKEDGEKGRTD